MALQTETTISRLIQMRIPIPMGMVLGIMPTPMTTATVFQTQMRLPTALIHSMQTLMMTG